MTVVPFGMTQPSYTSSFVTACGTARGATGCHLYTSVRNAPRYGREGSSAKLGRRSRPTMRSSSACALRAEEGLWRIAPVRVQDQGAVERSSVTGYAMAASERKCAHTMRLPEWPASATSELTSTSNNTGATPPTLWAKTHSINSRTEWRAERERKLDVGKAKRRLILEPARCHALLRCPCLHALLHIVQELHVERLGSLVSFVCISTEPL